MATRRKRSRSRSRSRSRRVWVRKPGSAGGGYYRKKATKRRRSRSRSGSHGYSRRRRSRSRSTAGKRVKITLYQDRLGAFARVKDFYSGNTLFKTRNFKTLASARQAALRHARGKKYKATVQKRVLRGVKKL